MNTIRIFNFASFLGFIFSFAFANFLFAQHVYTIHVNDILGRVDSAAVTFGDSTKYTQNGVVLFFDPVVGVNSDNNPTVPSSFKVSNAYPNPVKNSETKVNFVTRDNVINIKVYDITGKVVGSFSGGISPGSHSATFNGLNLLASGVYFVNISNDEGSKVVKVLNLNNGSNSSLNISVSNFAMPIHVLPKSSGSSYISLYVQMPGHVSYDEQVEPSRTDVIVVLDRVGKTIAGMVYDNESFSKIDVTGSLFANGNEFDFSTSNGAFDVQFPKSIDMIDSLKVWNDSTFIQTYRNVPIANDITNAGLFVTTYKNLNVSPDLFYDFVKEVAADEDDFDGVDNIVSIDFQNASRDYTYWIDKDFMYNNFSTTNYDTLSNEEQQHIADVIVDRFYSHMQDTTHMPKFYFAKAGDAPPRRPEGGVVYGTIFVTHLRGGNGYGYVDVNYGNDYLLDASEVDIGDPTNVDGDIVQEAASIISSRTGSLNPAIGAQSVFSEVSPTDYMMGIDIKLLKIDENILHDLNNPSITPIQEYSMPNGTTTQRFYYQTGVEVKDVLGKH